MGKFRLFNGFKVVRNAPLLWWPRYMSILVMDKQGRVIYPIGKWVTPHKDCGPLAVFGSLASAETFMRAFDAVRINLSLHHCEYELADDQCMWYVHKRLFKGDKIVSADSENLPLSTEFASRVRLGKQVKD